MLSRSFFMKKILSLIQKSWIKINAKRRKKDLKATNFTIISNNCWAEKIYKSYDMEYLTPTIGCFIMPEDFIRFCKQIEFYLNEELVEIEFNNSKYKDFFILNKEGYKKYGKYPIGIIDDVEIHFLHYSSFDEAKKKWDRRKKRVNLNKIFFKLNDQNGCTFDDYIQFQTIPQKSKIFFSSKNGWGIQIVKSRDLEYRDEPYGKSRKFNVTKYINGVVE